MVFIPRDKMGKPCCQQSRPLVVIVNQAPPRRSRRIGQGGAGEERRIFLAGTFTGPFPGPRLLTILTPIAFEGVLISGTFFVTIIPAQPLPEPIQVSFSFGVITGVGYTIIDETVTIAGTETVSFNVNEMARGVPVRPSSQFFVAYSVSTPTNLVVQVLDTSFVALV